MYEKVLVGTFLVGVKFCIINTNVWSCRIGSMTKFFSTCVEVILSMPLAKLHMLFFLHVSEVLRISRLTGKTGLVNKQDMGPIPVVLNI